MTFLYQMPSFVIATPEDFPFICVERHYVRGRGHYVVLFHLLHVTWRLDG